MTLTQLRYLVAIADSGLNITLAAERVHATQPGLSKQLKQLEDELGFLLFVRKGRSLESVTPAGQEVIERARLVLAEANSGYRQPINAVYYRNTQLAARITCFLVFLQERLG